jgi:hypothetical protein
MWRDATQQEFAQRRVLIGTHDQHIGAEFVCRVEQRRAEWTAADGKRVNLRGDPVLRHDRRHGRYGIAARTDQREHALGPRQAMQRRQHRLGRASIVTPRYGDAVAKLTG